MSNMNGIAPRPRIIQLWSGFVFTRECRRSVRTAIRLPERIHLSEKCDRPFSDGVPGHSSSAQECSLGYAIARRFVMVCWSIFSKNRHQASYANGERQRKAVIP